MTDEEKIARYNREMEQVAKELEALPDWVQRELGVERRVKRIRAAAERDARRFSGDSGVTVGTA